MSIAARQKYAQPGDNLDQAFAGLLKADCVAFWGALQLGVRTGSMDGPITEQELNEFEPLNGTLRRVRLICFIGPRVVEEK